MSHFSHVQSTKKKKKKLKHTFINLHFWFPRNLCLCLWQINSKFFCCWGFLENWKFDWWMGVFVFVCLFVWTVHAWDTCHALPVCVLYSWVCYKWVALFDVTEMLLSWTENAQHTKTFRCLPKAKFSQYLHHQVRNPTNNKTRQNKQSLTIGRMALQHQDPHRVSAKIEQW